MIQGIKLKMNNGLMSCLCSISSELEPGIFEQSQNNSYSFIFQQEILAELMKQLHDQPQGFTIVIDVINDLQLTELTREFNHLKSKLKELTRREREVLDLVRKNLSVKQIAETLFISNETVKSHRKNILLRTGCKGFDEIRQMLQQVENYEFLFT